MRILFMAQPYLNLHLPLLQEMKMQGHEVVFIEDKRLPTDCYSRGGLKIRNFIYSKYNQRFHVYEHYAEQLFDTHKEINKPFDCFFCIQGESLSSFFIHKLKVINPNLRTVFYAWDSNKFHDYFRNVQYFDKSYSFDFVDCQNDKRVEFLPFYWQNNHNEEIEYDLSCIGTDHDGRFRIVSKIYDQAKRNGLKCYIKIKPEKYYNARLFLIHPLKAFLNAREYKECFNSEIALHSLLPSAEVEKIIAQSNCIIDTDRECQTGTTPRVIWALSQGKKIISTNSSLKDLPFYNPCQILIIDRNNPILDIEFIKDHSKFETHALIKGLQISKWVNHILEF